MQPTITRLSALVRKYATEACQCDIMNGFECEVHTNLESDIRFAINPFVEIVRDLDGWVAKKREELGVDFDVHRLVVAEVEGINPEDVSDELRNEMKNQLFIYLYGGF